MTSLIPTSGSEVTRAADFCSVTGTNFSEWFKQPAGTFMVAYDYDYPNTSTKDNQHIINFRGDTSSKRYSITIPKNTGNVKVQSKKDSGAATYEAIFAKNASEVAFAYEFENNASAADGSLGTSLYNAGITEPIVLYIGTSNDTNDFGKVYFSRFSYYPTRLPDIALGGLTQP